MKIDIQNPIHPGFYETFINGDSNEEQYIECLEDNGELNLKKGQYANVVYNYKEFEFKVTQGIDDLFLEMVNTIIYEKYGVKDLFKKVGEELISPREYNFTTDRSFIDVEVDKKDFIMVIEQIFNDYYKQLDQYILKHHSSYDGFISFYSNDVDVWIKKDITELDSIELSSILNVLIENGEEIDYNFSSENIMYDMINISNDVFDQMELKIEIE
jgi:hypothetical protein